MALSVNLPKDWTPREYQLPAWQHMCSNPSFRALLMWHRRSGKDDIALHMTCRKAHQRKGNYWHMLPQANQARKAVWEAINPHTGKRRIDEAFPRELRRWTRNDEMSIGLKIGSTWQLCGSDNYDSLVGSPPAGVVLSEWALAKSAAWSYLRPILRENGGWAAFITTPRGKNHAYTMLNGAKKDPAWFSEVLNAEQTGVFTPEQLAAEKAELVRENGIILGEAIFDQEYMCSFDAALRGAYYTRELRDLRTENRIVENMPYEKLPVSLAWDLGMGDDMAIIAFQEIGREVRILAGFSGQGAGFDYYVGELLEPWRIKHRIPCWGDIILPHDAKVRELGTQTGMTRADSLRDLLQKTPIILDRLPIDDGINQVRKSFPRFWFNEPECGDLLEALSQYRREYDERNDAFFPQPAKSWANHYSDAFRYLALGLKSARPTERRDERGRRVDRRSPKLAII